MSPREKFQLGTAVSFAPASFLVAGVIAGMAQVESQHPSWGQGSKGFAKRYGAAYTDQAISTYMAQGVVPILFHQDPRYFRMGHGGFFRRIGYAVGRIAVTRTDAGSNQVNYSEFLGNAAAAGIANAYYPADDRTVGNTMQKFGTQIATDAAFNVLKEFWPDIHRKLFHKSEGGNLQAASIRNN